MGHDDASLSRAPNLWWIDDDCRPVVATKEFVLKVMDCCVSCPTLWATLQEPKTERFPHGQDPPQNACRCVRSCLESSLLHCIESIRISSP